MKRRKSIFFVTVVVMVFINTVISVPMLNNNSQLSLQLVEANADGYPVETKDPNEDPIPEGSQPEEWFSILIDFLF